MAYDVSVGGAHLRVRNPWAPVLLGICTFGIYGIYWYYSINREMKDFGRARGDMELAKTEPLLSVLATTIGALVIVPPFVSFVNTIRRIRRAEAAAGREQWDTGVIFALAAATILTLGLAGIVFQAMMQSRLSSLWQAESHSGIAGPAPTFASAGASAMRFGGLTPPPGAAPAPPPPPAWGTSGDGGAGNA